MIPVTAIVAALLSLFLVRLSLNVIGLRRKNRVSLGSGGVDALERAIRAQGNFAEYVPIGLILLALLEANRAPWWLVAALGAVLVAGRILHAAGVQQPPPDFSRRVLGMQLTFGALILAALANLVWVGLLLR